MGLLGMLDARKGCWTYMNPVILFGTLPRITSSACRNIFLSFYRKDFVSVTRATKFNLVARTLVQACGGLKEYRPLQAAVFEHLVPSWECCLARWRCLTGRGTTWGWVVGLRVHGLTTLPLHCLLHVCRQRCTLSGPFFNTLLPCFPTMNSYPLEVVVSQQLPWLWHFMAGSRVATTTMILVSLPS